MIFLNQDEARVQYQTASTLDLTAAEKYAPNWGRLHLKWGEALGYAGRNDEAHAQYQTASTLDLTPYEKAELAKVSHG